MPSVSRFAFGAVLVLLVVAPARADQCTGAKLKAIGNKEAGLLGCQAKVAATNDSSGLSACEMKVMRKFVAAFARAGTCVGDQTTCENIADSCASTVTSVLTDTLPSRCEAVKRKAAGNLAKTELGCYSKAARRSAPLDPGCITKAQRKFGAVLTHAGTCPDGGSPQSLVENNCVKPGVRADGGGTVRGVCPTTTTLTTTTTMSTATSTTTSTTVPVTGSDWRGVYGAWSVDESSVEPSFTTLESLGINLVIANIGLDESNADPNFPGWQQWYASAVAHNLNLIPILWDGGQNQTVWHWTGSEFKLDISKYPTDPGAQFLNFLQTNPIYKAHTFAVFSFHEPFNPQNPGQRTVLQSQTLWTQFHAMFGDTLPLYGESAINVNGCANGCVDYAGLGVYNFASCGGQPLYADVDEVSASDGIDFSTQLCVTSEAETIQRAGAMLDAVYNYSHTSPPAPNGSFTKIVPLIQTFVAPLPEVSRMPSAAEMRAWVDDIVLPRKDRLVGVVWYSWSKASSTYITSLEFSQFDSTGADRWQAVKDIRGEIVP